MPIKKNVVPALHPTEILPEPYSIILSDSLLYPFSSYTVSGRRNGYGGGGIWEPSETMVRGTIVVVIDNAGLDKAVIYIQTAGKRIICRGGDKRREIEEVFDIGDLLRLIHGGYDVRVNVTDINGNWATGKTHIDSALQTLKKGLSALLISIIAIALQKYITTSSLSFRDRLGFFRILSLAWYIYMGKIQTYYVRNSCRDCWLRSCDCAMFS